MVIYRHLNFGCLENTLANEKKSELNSPSSLQWKHTMSEVEKRKCMEKRKWKENDKSLKRGSVWKGKSQKEQLYFFSVSLERKLIFVHGRKWNTTSWSGQNATKTDGRSAGMQKNNFKNWHMGMFSVQECWNSSFWITISTPEFTEPCHYQPIFKLASNGYRCYILKDIFAFSYFDNHSNISHTKVHLNEREVVLCC